MASLAFNRSDMVSFPSIPAPAVLANQIGTGTTILTAESTYSGGTTIGVGTLQLGNGGRSGEHPAGNVAEQRHAGIQSRRHGDASRG